MCIVNVEIKKTTLGTTKIKKGGFYSDLYSLTATDHNDDDLLQNDGSGTLTVLKNRIEREKPPLKQKKQSVDVKKTRTHIVYITAI